MERILPNNGKAITGVNGQSVYYMTTDELYPMRTPRVDDSYNVYNFSIPTGSSDLKEAYEPEELSIEEENGEEGYLIEEDQVPKTTSKKQVKETAKVADVTEKIEEVKVSGVSCPVPICPKPVCPQPVCPEVDYVWLQTNFYVVVGLLLFIVIFLWVQVNRNR